MKCSSKLTILCAVLFIALPLLAPFIPIGENAVEVRASPSIAPLDFVPKPLLPREAGINDLPLITQMIIWEKISLNGMELSIEGVQFTAQLKQGENEWNLGTVAECYSDEHIRANPPTLGGIEFVIDTHADDAFQNQPFDPSSTDPLVVTVTWEASYHDILPDGGSEALVTGTIDVDYTGGPFSGPPVPWLNSTDILPIEIEEI